MRHCGNPTLRQRNARGFTLVEALLAISITTMAGIAVLQGIASYIEASDIVVERTIGAGIAEQILDEVSGCRFHAAGVGPFQTDLGPNSWEQMGDSRQRYDDIDDFADYSADELLDPFGDPIFRSDGNGEWRHPNFRLPTQAANGWRESIDVYYVSETDPTQRLTGTQTSYLRCVEVQVFRQNGDGWKRVAWQKRIFGYVPSEME